MRNIDKDFANYQDIKFRAVALFGYFRQRSHVCNYLISQVRYLYVRYRHYSHLAARVTFMALKCLHEKRYVCVFVSVRTTVWTTFAWYKVLLKCSVYITFLLLTNFIWYEILHNAFSNNNHKFLHKRPCTIDFQSITNGRISQLQPRKS